MSHWEKRVKPVHELSSRAREAINKAIDDVVVYHTQAKVVRDYDTEPFSNKTIPSEPVVLSAYLKTLPAEYAEVIQRTARKLVLARNYESGDKPGDLKDALFAAFEATLSLPQSKTAGRPEIRTLVNAIDAAIIQGVKNERSGNRNR